MAGAPWVLPGSWVSRMPGSKRSHGCVQVDRRGLSGGAVSRGIIVLEEVMWSQPDRSRSGEWMGGPSEV